MIAKLHHSWYVDITTFILNPFQVENYLWKLYVYYDLDDCYDMYF